MATLSKGSVVTAFADGRWVNTVEGDSESSHALDDFDDAVAAGRALARDSGVEHVILDRDGRVAQRNSYESDPHSSIV